MDHISRFPNNTANHDYNCSTDDTPCLSPKWSLYFSSLSQVDAGMLDNFSAGTRSENGNDVHENSIVEEPNFDMKKSSPGPYNR